MRRVAAALALALLVAVEVGAQTTPSRTFRFRDSDASHHIDVQAPATVATDRLCELEDDATPFDPCVTASAGGGTSDGGAGVLQGSDGSGGFAAFGGSSCPASEFATSISSAGGLVCDAAGGLALEDEDSALPTRPTLNFEGAGVTCADDTDQTTCTIPGGGGSGALSVATKTGAYAATSSDDVLICDPTGGAFTIALPAASGFTKRLTITKAKVASWNACTIDPDGAETIGGFTTLNLAIPTHSVTVASTGSEWIIVEEAKPVAFHGATSNWASGTIYWHIEGHGTVAGIVNDRVTSPMMPFMPVGIRCHMWGGNPDNGGGTEGYTLTLMTGGTTPSDWSCALMDTTQTCDDFTGSEITAGSGIVWRSVSTGSPQTSRWVTCSIFAWSR